MIDQKRMVKLGFKLLMVCSALFYFCFSQNTTLNYSGNSATSIEQSSYIKIASFQYADNFQVIEDRVDEKTDKDLDTEISKIIVFGGGASEIPFKAHNTSQPTFQSEYRIYDINCCWKLDLA